MSACVLPISMAVNQETRHPSTGNDIEGIPASSHAFLFSKFWNEYVEEIYSSVYRKTHHEKVLMALTAQHRI